MSEKPIGGVDNPPPEEYRRSIEHAIGYVCWLAEKSGALKQGQTPLYWALYHTVSNHCGQDQEP